MHAEYGIGQVMGVVKKDISGKMTRYVKIKANQSTFWLPENELDNMAIRPLSTQDQLQEAIACLQQTPIVMPANYKERYKQIQEARTDNSLLSIAQIIRDLRAQSRQKGNLTTSESRAWRALKLQFSEEWAILSGLSTEEAGSRLDQLLG